MKLISIVTGCYNEQDNVGLLHAQITEVFKQLPEYRYELIFIDNASTDQTVARLRQIAQDDKRVKVIVNRRNFGAVRSSYHAFLQAHGDAVIAMASDLQDPPALIPDMVKRWENGDEMIAAVKSQSRESMIIFGIRSLYYKMLKKMAKVEVIEQFTGFGLYDQKILRELRKLNDSYPYIRGLVSELGFSPSIITFVQPKRQHGKSNLNFYDLFDMAMLGLTTHSVVPMRIATLMGFFLSMTSLLIALFYLVYKLVFWTSFSVGIAPLVIGMFGMFSIQLMFIGLLGEYVGSSHRQALNRPLVVEKERINFDSLNSAADGTDGADGSDRSLKLEAH